MEFNLTRISIFEGHRPIVPLQTANTSMNGVSCFKIANLLNYIFSAPDALALTVLRFQKEKYTNLSPVQ